MQKQAKRLQAERKAFLAFLLSIGQIKKSDYKFWDFNHIYVDCVAPFTETGLNYRKTEVIFKDTRYKERLSIQANVNWQIRESVFGFIT